MSAHSLPLNIDKALRNGFFQISDPGASQVFSWSGKGFVIVEVVTAGAEGRTLPNAPDYGLGTRLLVLFKTDGGDLTISGADSSVVLDTAGQFAEFVVTDNNGTNVWRIASTSALIGGAVTNVVTRATAAAGAGKIPVSNGADRALKAATPVALGTVDINTGDAATDAAIIALVNALTAFGLTTATWT